MNKPLEIKDLGFRIEKNIFEVMNKGLLNNQDLIQIIELVVCAKSSHTALGGKNYKITI